MCLSKVARQCFLVCFGLLLLSVHSTLGQQVSPVSKVVSIEKLPISFEPNYGQAGPTTQFLARVGNMDIELHPRGATLVLRSGNGPSVLKLDLVGSNSHAGITASELKASETNYLIGRNPSHWHTHIPNFGRVTYSGVYRGIDAVFYGNGQQLEHDFLVASGADYRVIRIRLDGADAIAQQPDGSLKIALADGEVSLRRPDVYQIMPNGRKPLEGGFSLLGKNEIGFKIRHYDRSQPLVIDPVLSYSTYLADISLYIAAIATDSSGSSYVTGQSFSVAYPTTPGAFQPACNSCASDLPDIFVTKLNASGSGLVYSTFIGGSGFDQPFALAVDSLGNAIVAGRTASEDFPLKNPIPAGPPTNLAFYGFITSLSADGSSLNYSSVLGGEETFTDGLALTRPVMPTSPAPPTHLSFP
ncbi:MAG TPA: hypothetical protein VNE63_05170 [Candidatus Acidoferrales bacterium]|nr:hypothetical protein [Candidatus Acidoferrales bacterium]